MTKRADAKGAEERRAEVVWSSPNLKHECDLWQQ